MCFSAQPGGGFVPECLDGHCVPAAGIQTIFLNETFTQNDGNDWNFKKKRIVLFMYVIGFVLF